MLPRDDWGDYENAAPIDHLWGDYENAAPIDHLDLAAELRRWGGVGTAGRLQPGSVDAPTEENAAQPARGSSSLQARTPRPG